MKIDLNNPFFSSAKAILWRMGNVELLSDGLFYPEGDAIASKGVTSIISFDGKVKGRLLLDMEPDTAIFLTRNITGKYLTNEKNYTVLSAASEINNIIAGDGITYLNNTHSLGLRLSPPIVFAGKDALVCLDKIPGKSVSCKTMYGDLKIIVAIERSLYIDEGRIC